MHDIKESQAICDAATPEPWEWGDPPDEDESNCDGWMTLAHAHIGWWGDGMPGGEDDAAFIAHARTALPAANRELAEARKVMAQMAEALKPFTPHELGDHELYQRGREALEAYRKLEKHNADEH